MSRLVSIALGTVALLATSVAVGSQLEVAERAEHMITDKIDAGEQPLERRVRALYRLGNERAHRGLLAPTSVASKSDRRARVRSNLKWLIRNDVVVRRALHNERQNVRDEIVELKASSPARRPSLNSPLRRPVSGKVLVGFGQRRAGKLRLTSRGVTFESHAGERVLAPAAGRIVFSGLVGGDLALIIDIGDHWIVLSGLADTIAIDASVERGQPIAKVAGNRIELELRVIDERGGEPISPLPLVTN